MKILDYSDVKISVMRSTESPGQLISAALQLTQKKDIKFHHLVKDETLKYLIHANHTSVLEHWSATFLIENVSRSFLAQITRHRMASYTASSQHYQDYRNYPLVMDDSLLKSPYVGVNEHFKMVLQSYKNLVNNGVPKWEARQVLPNASACTIIWTINARSLVNFLNLRMCKRNVPEMLNFAEDLHDHCMILWPGLFQWISADCAMYGECTQGKMTCGEPYEKIK